MAMNYQNFASLGVNLNRQKYGPLDISNVFTSAADLQYYLTKGAVTEGVSEYWYKNADEKIVPYPYEGQVLATVIDGVVNVYALALDAEGNFTTQEIAGKIEVDGNTVKLNEEGKLELAGLDKVEAGKTYVPSLINGVLTWAEPDTSTAEGQAQEINSLKTRTVALEETINGTEEAEGLVEKVEGIDERLATVEEDYLVEADLADFAKTTDVVANSDFETFKTANDEAIAAAKSGAETTAAGKLAEARVEISAEIDEDVKVAKDRADEAYELAESKVDATEYTADKEALEAEDAAIRAIAEDAQSKIDTFLSSEEVDETVNTLKEIKAELDKMADATSMTEALACKADKDALEGVADRVKAIEEAPYATEADVNAVDAKFADYTTTEDLVTELAKKQDVIVEGTYATPTDIATAKSEAIEEAQNKATAAKEAAIADADAKLANKANAADVYSKTETYSQEEVDALLEGIQAGSSESAASVATKLDSLKKAINVEVYGNEEATGDSRIDKLEAVGAQANVIESVVAAEGALVKATKVDKEVTIDDSALVTQIDEAREQADAGVAAATANAEAIEALDAQVSTNKADINTISGRLTPLETAKGDHETRIGVVEGKITALDAADKDIIEDIGELNAKAIALENEDIRLAGAIDTKANATDVYTKAEVNSAIEAAIDEIPEVNLEPYAKLNDVNSMISDVNAEVATKANASDVYTKEEADAAVKAVTGEVPADKTIVTMIADAKAEATYDDTDLAARVTANEEAIEVINGEAEGSIKHAVKALADGAVKANADAIAILNSDATVEGSVAKTADDRIAAALAGADADFDTLREMSDWLSNHEDSAATMNSAISDNAAAIKVINETTIPQAIADANKYTDDKITELDLANTYEAKGAAEAVSAELETYKTTVAGQFETVTAAVAGNTSALATLNGTGDGSVKKAIDDAILALPAATASALGLVKASAEITVAEDGTMGIGQVSTDKLVMGDNTLVLNGGTAQA